MKGSTRLRAVTVMNEGVLDANGIRKSVEYVNSNRTRWIAGFGSHPSGFFRINLSFKRENLVFG